MSNEERYEKMDVAQPVPSEPVFRTPACDVIEQENGVRVLLDMPGVEPDKVDINVHNRVLEVRADTPFAWRGRAIRYKRSFQLSDDIDSGGISANFKSGVLDLSLPKAESAKVHKVKVETV